MTTETPTVEPRPMTTAAIDSLVEGWIKHKIMNPRDIAELLAPFLPVSDVVTRAIWRAEYCSARPHGRRG